jgi:tRNA nucleotidyltransferase/poly(A) polymerase/peptidoglycan hydrolase-like protein with peptidoglycan-binding domain
VEPHDDLSEAAGGTPPPKRRGGQGANQEFEGAHPRSAKGRVGGGEFAKKPGQGGAAKPKMQAVSVASALKAAGVKSIAEFQKTRGLPVTGRLDSRTMVALRNAYVAHLVDLQSGGGTAAGTNAAAKAGVTLGLHDYAKRGMGTKADPDSRVSRVQQTLERLGYDVPIDGVYSSELETAVKQFQADHGLPATGVVSVQTLRQMDKLHSQRDAGKEPGGGLSADTPGTKHRVGTDEVKSLANRARAGRIARTGRVAATVKTTTPKAKAKPTGTKPRKPPATTAVKITQAAVDEPDEARFDALVIDGEEVEPTDVTTLPWWDEDETFAQEAAIDWREVLHPRNRLGKFRRVFGDPRPQTHTQRLVAEPPVQTRRTAGKLGARRTRRETPVPDQWGQKLIEHAEWSDKDNKWLQEGGVLATVTHLATAHRWPSIAPFQGFDAKSLRNSEGELRIRPPQEVNGQRIFEQWWITAAISAAKKGVTEMVIAHEVGHMLDASLMRPEDGQPDPRNKRMDYHFHGSEAAANMSIETIERQGFAMSAEQHARWREFLKIAVTPSVLGQTKYAAKYHRSPAELWARAYAQWAASTQGPPLGIERAAIPGMTWPADEWEPVGRAVESVLGSYGLLHTDGAFKWEVQPGGIEPQIMPDAAQKTMNAVHKFIGDQRMHGAAQALQGFDFKYVDTVGGEHEYEREVGGGLLTGFVKPNDPSIRWEFEADVQATPPYQRSRRAPKPMPEYVRQEGLNAEAEMESRGVPPMGVLLDRGFRSEDSPSKAHAVYAKTFPEGKLRARFKHGEHKVEWKWEGDLPDITSEVSAPLPVPPKPEWVRPDDPEGESSDEFLVRMARERERTMTWEQEVKRGLSVGRWTEAEAKEAGYHTQSRGEGWEPLPDGPLFHVTTAASAVRAGGLKTRYELAQGSGAGLGGGAEDTISFTTDETIARAIALGLREMRMVARGEVSAADLLRHAENGTAADRPFATDLIRYYDYANRAWSPGDELPSELRLLLDGKRRVGHTHMPSTREEAAAEAGIAPELLTHSDQSMPFGRGARNDWVGPMTDAQLREKTVDFYRAFQTFREGAGGPFNPLFFSSDTEALANVHPSEIRILRFRRKANGHGYRTAGMEEIRTGSGEAVQLEDVLREDAFDLSEATHEWTTLRTDKVRVGATEVIGPDVTTLSWWREEAVQEASWRSVLHPRDRRGRWRHTLGKPKARSTITIDPGTFMPPSGPLANGRPRTRAKTPVLDETQRMIRDAPFLDTDVGDEVPTEFNVVMAQAVVAEAHRWPELPPLTFVLGDLEPGVKGELSITPPVPPFQEEAWELALDEKLMGVEGATTFAHEMGHAVDAAMARDVGYVEGNNVRGAVGNFGYFASGMAAADNPYGEVLLGPERFAAWRHFLKMAVTQSIVDEMSSPPDYYRSPHELWARAYAQWVATQDEALMGEMHDVHEHGWPQDEWEPVGRAVERVLGAHGLLYEGDEAWVAEVGPEPERRPLRQPPRSQIETPLPPVIRQKAVAVMHDLTHIDHNQTGVTTDDVMRTHGFAEPEGEALADAFREGLVGVGYKLYVREFPVGRAWFRVRTGEQPPTEPNFSWIGEALPDPLTFVVEAPDDEDDLEWFPLATPDEVIVDGEVIEGPDVTTLPWWDDDDVVEAVDWRPGQHPRDRRGRWRDVLEMPKSNVLDRISVKSRAEPDKPLTTKLAGHEVPVVVGEIDMSYATTTRVVAAFAAVKDHRFPVGFLTIDRDKHRVELIYVETDNRRQGIATALYRAGLALYPDLIFDADRTDEGEAFTTATGGKRERRRKFATAEARRIGSRFLGAMYGATAEDIKPIEPPQSEGPIRVASRSGYPPGGEWRRAVGLGEDAYLVGGAPRNRIFGEPVKDEDFMALQTPEAIKAAALAAGHTVEDLMVRDRLVGVRVTGSKLPSGGIEIAPPRVERSTGAGRHDFEIVPHPGIGSETPEVLLAADAARRDFTFNALYEDAAGNIVDPTGTGLADAQAKALRTVSPDSFKEDPLRILRGLRFMSQYDVKPVPDTTTQMRLHASSVNALTKKGVSGTARTELDKILMGPHVGAALRQMRDTGVLEHFLPEVAPAVGFNQESKYHGLTLDEHIISAVEAAAAQGASLRVRLALLFHDSGKPESAWRGEDGHLHYYANPKLGKDAHEDVGAAIARRALTRLGYPAKVTQDVERLVAAHMLMPTDRLSKIRRLRAEHGELLDDLFAHRRADMSAKGEDHGAEGHDALERMHEEVRLSRTRGEAVRRGDLAVTGADIVALGVKGPAVGEVLAVLLDFVIGDPSLNRRDWLLARAEKLARRHLSEAVRVTPVMEAWWRSLLHPRDRRGRFMDKLGRPTQAVSRERNEYPPSVEYFGPFYDSPYPMQRTRDEEPDLSPQATKLMDDISGALIRPGSSDLERQTARQTRASAYAVLTANRWPRIPKTSIAVKRDMAEGTHGHFATTGSGTDVERWEIAMSEASVLTGKSVTTIVHEMGHALDAAMAYPVGDDRLALRVYGEVKKSHLASGIAASENEAGHEMLGLERVAAWRRFFKASITQSVLDADVRPGYHRAPHELWARAYTQWVASTDPLLAEHLRRLNWNQGWPPQEWERVGLAVEDVLRAHGLLYEHDSPNARYAWSVVDPETGEPTEPTIPDLPPLMPPRGMAEPLKYALPKEALDDEVRIRDDLSNVTEASEHPIDDAMRKQGFSYAGDDTEFVTWAKEYPEGRALIRYPVGTKPKTFWALGKSAWIGSPRPDPLTHVVEMRATERLWGGVGRRMRQHGGYAERLHPRDRRGRWRDTPGQITVRSEDWRAQHRPPSKDDDVGGPLHDLTQVMPADVYTHPHYYFTTGGDPDSEAAYRESWAAIQRVRGKPDAKVRIYRSLPAEHAHNGFHEGDWVTLSKTYARRHGMGMGDPHADDSENDWPVISTTVLARDLLTHADDLNEWGYVGPGRNTAMVAFKGGRKQEVRQHADGVVRPVKRRGEGTIKVQSAGSIAKWRDEGGWDAGVFFHVTPREDAIERQGAVLPRGHQEDVQAQHAFPVDPDVVYLWPSAAKAEKHVGYMERRGVTGLTVVPVHADVSQLEPDPEPFLNLWRQASNYEAVAGVRQRENLREHGYAALDEARHYPDPVNHPEGETLREYLATVTPPYVVTSPSDDYPPEILADPWIEARRVLADMPVALRRDVARVFSQHGVAVLARGRRPLAEAAVAAPEGEWDVIVANGVRREHFDVTLMPWWHDLAEASFAERLHPRDRRGRWRRGVSHLATSPAATVSRHGIGTKRTRREVPGEADMDRFVRLLDDRFHRDPEDPYPYDVPEFVAERAASAHRWPEAASDMLQGIDMDWLSPGVMGQFAVDLGEGEWADDPTSPTGVRLVSGPETLAWIRIDPRSMPEREGDPAYFGPVLAHELGHLLDTSLAKQAGQSAWRSDEGHDGELNGASIMAALDPPDRRLTDAQVAAWRGFFKAAVTPSVEAMPNPRYNRSPDELFARAYAQWIGTTMRDQMEREFQDAPEGMHRWPPDEWEPVGAALEAVLDEFGLLYDHPDHRWLAESYVARQHPRDRKGRWRLVAPHVIAKAIELRNAPGEGRQGTRYARPTGDPETGKVLHGVGTLLDRAAEKQGRTRRELDAKLQSQVERLVGPESGTVPMMRVRPGSLRFAFRTWHFPNAHESPPEPKETYRGADYRKARARSERDWFGISPSAPPEHFPHYGYMARPDEEDWLKNLVGGFGKIRVRLKPQTRGRTTFTYSDSLYVGSHDDSIVPSPVDEPKGYSVSATSAFFVPWLEHVARPLVKTTREQPPLTAEEERDLADWKRYGRHVMDRQTGEEVRLYGDDLVPEFMRRRAQRLEDEGVWTDATWDDFFEAQIHGGVEWDDVDGIDFPEDPGEDVLRELAQRNISFTIAAEAVESASDRARRVMERLQT